ncbi:MAG: FMN-binding negative transcriptional regulator [Novosphingobium sp.]|nr:FMN-binding negative transcriptional regulator [Novosphingobium sp.]
MHPNSDFRPNLPPREERALLETLIDQIGFGMVFATTPDGPRVAHVPLHSTGDGALHFHLARGNALASHVNGMTALVVVNGPDAYVSPRWYADREQVPTWNYISLELEGRVRRMDRDGLKGHIETLVERQEAWVEGGKSWSLEELPDAKFSSLEKGIIGFELEVQAWRPTLKLSQNKSVEDRARVADALESSGSPALAQLMRSLAP